MLHTLFYFTSMGERSERRIAVREAERLGMHTVHGTAVQTFPLQ